MGLISIFPSGGLDKDTDKNMLAQGDYPDARNIIVGTGKAGGKDTVKLLESIKSIALTGVDDATGTFKTAHKAQSGLIYELYRTDSTNAAIYVISVDRTTRTLVLSYAHTATTDFTPDLKAIGNNLVWNYYGTGKLLYWDITRANGTTPVITDLLLAKAPPINAHTIAKASVGNESVDFLELNDFQFASRYKYDNGEYSTLSAYTEIFKGAKDTSSYTFTFNNTNKPSFALEIEVYCRIGNAGTWRRIHTATVSASGAAVVPSAYVWKGQYFETLSDLESNEIFSAVPATVGSIEVAIDRIFVADYVDDYNNDSVGAITLTTSTGYAVPSGGAIKTYFGVLTTDAGINSQETGTYYKPFANKSSYSIGMLIFDAALKTRGVEFVSTFNTGLFSTIIAPVINIDTTGYTKPTYAKWGQLCITKNLSKSRTYEGFASSIYFEVEEEETNATTSTVTKVVKNRASVADANVPNIKSLVVDISGLYKAGHIYSYQNGDRILINVPDGVAVGITFTGTYRVLDLEVSYGDSQKVHCNWTGGACMNDDIPDATKLYFEIYSIRQQAEEDSTLFYGIGDLFDISSSIPSSITNYKLGDTVFKKVSFAQYTQALYHKGKVKSNPATVTTGAIVFSRAGKESATVTTSLAIDVSSTTDKLNYYPLLTTFGTNDDTATAVGGGVISNGFFDSLSYIRFNNNFNIVESAALAIGGDGEGGLQVSVEVVIVKRAFKQDTQTFENEVAITKSAIIYNRQLYSDEFGNVDTTEVFTDDIEMEILSKVVIGAGDEIKAKLNVYINKSVDTFTGVIDLKGTNGIENYCTLSWSGDRISPSTAYFAKSVVPVASSKTDFAVRAMSNSLENLTGWNVSGGKPYIRTSKKISQSIVNGIRSSGNLIFGTEINNIGRFSVLDSFDVPIENGRILSLQRASRLQGDGDMLLALCQNESSYILLGESSMNQSSNAEFSAVGSSIIGSVRNLGGRAGLANKESVFNYNGDVYWWNNTKKNVCQFTKEGLDILSDKKMKSEFIGRDGIAKIAVDPFHKLLLINIGSECIGYNIGEGRWTSFYDVVFDYSIEDGDRALFFKNGLLYRSLESASGNKVAEYFGSTYISYVSLMANTIVPIMPQSVILSHNMNVTDNNQANRVKASLFGIVITNENSQQTEIKEVNFLLENNKLYAHVLRDTSNSGNIISGRFIIGYSNLFKLTLKDFTQENRIFAIEVSFDKVTGH
jgi:hypothetical protein